MRWISVMYLQLIRLTSKQQRRICKMIDTTKALLPLINKYNISGPRYTSYPTALQFSDSFSTKAHLSDFKFGDDTPLSLYIHIPFCHQLCYYCGCNKIVTRHQSKAEVYLDHLALEIARVSKLFGHRKLHHVHLGGGTPTFLTTAQMARLVALIQDSFTIEVTTESEWCVEIDPRSIDDVYLENLHDLGFNRLSFGLQDFDFEVQTAINRVQDFAHIKRLFDKARTIGFRSINADMIYGLPLQTPASFNASIERLIALSPDRVSVFNYAHLPSKFAAQRKIHSDDLPTPSQKIEMFTQTIDVLKQNGYQYIGIDHFAKENDSLAQAQREGKLHRNFQGYTTHRDTDLLGLGVSAISQIGNVMIQNKKELKAYYADVSDDTLEGFTQQTGVVSSEDDIIRAHVIKELMCHYEISFSKLEKKFKFDPVSYFEREVTLLENFVSDGVLELTNDGYRVTEIGVFFIRNIAMCFDTYLSKQLKTSQYSRVI